MLRQQSFTAASQGHFVTQPVGNEAYFESRTVGEDRAGLREAHCFFRGTNSKLEVTGDGVLGFGDAPSVTLAPLAPVTSFLSASRAVPRDAHPFAQVRPPKRKSRSLRVAVRPGTRRDSSVCRE